MTEQAMTRNEQEAQIIAKSWQDEAFKQELLSNPKATVIRELGLQNVSDNLEIKVLEEDANTLYLVMPMKPHFAAGEAELSEEQLEAVAGGGIIKSLVNTIGTGILGCINSGC